MFIIRYTYAGRTNELDQSSHQLTVATRDLFGELDRNVSPVAPMQFWMVSYSYCALSYNSKDWYDYADYEDCYVILCSYMNVLTSCFWATM